MIPANPRRALAAGAAAILSASLLSGCAAFGADPSEPSAVEEAFLQALADGDGQAAVALTTLDRDEVSCWDLISDYRSYSVGIATTNDVEDAEVDGNTATVGFRYTMVSNRAEATEVSGEHTLIREDDRWLIEFPEEYRILASVPADLVADVGFHEIGTTEGAGVRGERSERGRLRGDRPSRLVQSRDRRPHRGVPHGGGARTRDGLGCGTLR